jgi:hypothetical protein
MVKVNDNERASRLYEAFGIVEGWRGRIPLMIPVGIVRRSSCSVAPLLLPVTFLSLGHQCAAFGDATPLYRLEVNRELRGS